MKAYLDTQSMSVRAVRLVITLLILFLLFQFVSLYFSWPKQVVVGTISILIVLILNRKRHSQAVTICLMLISIASTLRYGWWRVHLIVQYFSDDSNPPISVDSILMLVLLSAEAYTILIMLLGYMQTVAPLHRKPVPLPVDEALWPHVDVLIPTYNEKLDLVRYTALAALNIDYPPDKLHVYILDDGTREEFQRFADAAGVGYITRKDHKHAKAGNINHALTKMTAPLVAIFDCDHVPTRSFLQVTVGWFLAEKKLAMLQTPHFFYSPDPFERNLPNYQTIPNEGELFYGVIQDGNDLWNATFFCGSCAVIRRSALEQVGGIATETVTEDAHTSLRLQKRGWNTAYINLPLAAGLATETLSAHVGQRIRWARGMIQILRTENPMLASGMKFTQRLCYFNAMLHFMYAVPRLVFLCAPLVYMIFGRTIIPGYWVAILAYALPHLVISSATNSRVQGRFRHSFWNEIYETVLAPYILLPTLFALINPKLGKFNVTDKGSTLAETSFDRNIALPTTLLLAFNLVGVCMTPYRLRVTDPTHPGTVISNLVWIFFNMVILGVAGAVAYEKQQRRSSMRIPAQIAVKMRRPDGKEAEGVTMDISVGGAAVTLPGETALRIGDPLRVSFPKQTRSAEVGAHIGGKTEGRLRVQFDATTIREQETITRALYSRANSWVSARAKGEEDRPLVSLGRVILISFTGFKRILLGLLPRKKAAAAVFFIASLGLLRQPASAQIPGTITAPEPAAASPPAPAASSPAAPALASSEVQQLPPEVTFETANERISFKDMGVHGAIELHGPHSYYSVGFVLPHDRLPEHAALELSYHFAASVRPRAGKIRITVNGQFVGVLTAPEQPQTDREFAFVSLRVPAELLIRNNDITFEFTGGSGARNTKSEPETLANIGATSRILVSGDHLALQTDLSLLPQPLFDPDLQTTTTIPFVFLSPPSPRTLESAAIVASWLGIQASSKPPRFSVSIGSIPAGNVVVFVNGDEASQPALHVPYRGSSLSLSPNPSDPANSALVLSGDDDAGLLNVARGLALMHVSHLPPGQSPPRIGQAVRIGDFALPPARKPDDAPRWLTTDKTISLWSTDSQQAMESNGSKPVPVYFRVPPDLYYGEIENLNLRLSYRYNAVPLDAGSALRLYLNGSLVSETPLPPGPDFPDRRRTILLPVEHMRPFGNTFLFNFDFIPTNPNRDERDVANRLIGDIRQDSWVDLRGLDHWARMPDLELFANAGFPFTRKADLADTTVVMPYQSSPKEIELLLYVMSHCGIQTGYPALRVEIVTPDSVMSATRDYLIIGGVDNQPAFGTLDSAMPVTFDANGVHVKEDSGYLSDLGQTWQKWLGRDTQQAVPSNLNGAPDLMIEGLESPYYPGRSIVLLAIRTDNAVDEFADAFLERSQSSDINGSVSLLRKAEFTSYAVNPSNYHVGYISWYSLMRLWLAEHFWVLLCVVSLLSLVLAFWIRDYLVWLAARRVEVDA